MFDIMESIQIDMINDEDTLDELSLSLGSKVIMCFMRKDPTGEYLLIIDETRKIYILKNE